MKDALEVNAALAEVRTTIEKLEGRQRFLEKRVSTSTIELSVAESAPLVSASRFAFGPSLTRAAADLLNVSAAILHGSIRTLGVLVLILALVVVPGALMLRACSGACAGHRRADAGSIVPISLAATAVRYVARASRRPWCAPQSAKRNLDDQARVVLPYRRPSASPLRRP